MSASNKIKSNRAESTRNQQKDVYELLD